MGIVLPIGQLFLIMCLLKAWVAEPFPKWRGTIVYQTNYRNFLWLKLATVTTQALEHDVNYFCQHVQAILCNI